MNMISLNLGCRIKTLKAFALAAMAFSVLAFGGAQANDIDTGCDAVAETGVAVPVTV